VRVGSTRHSLLGTVDTVDKGGEGAVAAGPSPDLELIDGPDRAHPPATSGRGSHV
jgi:hypothetical protein